MKCNEQIEKPAFGKAGHQDFQIRDKGHNLVTVNENELKSSAMVTHAFVGDDVNDTGDMGRFVRGAISALGASFTDQSMLHAVEGAKMGEAIFAKSVDLECGN